MIILDLENLAFLATSLGPLKMRCQQLHVELRAYTSPEHDWASRATHHSASDEKEAADVRMVLDASNLIRDQIKRHILIITDDRFGQTLAAEEPGAINHVTFSSTLPTRWRQGFTPHDTIEDFFKTYGVHKERVERSYGGSVSSRSGFSSHSNMSRTRASWSKPARSDRGDDLGVPTRRITRETEHLKQKLDLQRNEIESLKLQVEHQHSASHNEGQLRAQLMELQRQLSVERAERVRLQTKGTAHAGTQGIQSAAQQSTSHVAKLHKDRTGRKRGGPRRWPRGIEQTAGKIVGTVKFFSEEKGFGFLTTASVGDVFYHKSALMCDGTPTAALAKWDLEFHLVTDRFGRYRAEKVSGPNAQLIPLAQAL